MFYSCLLAVDLRKEKQLKEYGPEGMAHIQNCKALEKYIARRAIASPATAKSYQSKLNRFGLFLFKTYPGKSFDELIAEIKTDKVNPYDLLADYAAFLGKDHKANHLRAKVKGAKKVPKILWNQN